MVSRKFLKKNWLSKFSVRVILDTYLWKQGSRFRAGAAKGKPAFRDCITRGKHRVQNGVSRGKCGPRKTEKYFRLIMNRVPEYSHLVFIIPVYLRTITLSKSLVIVHCRCSWTNKKVQLSWTNQKVQLSWTNKKSPA